MNSLYGMSIELPPGWQDTTEYLFRAGESPIPKLVFARQALAADDVDGWLKGVREEMSLVEGFIPSPIEAYEHATLAARGFTVSVGEGEGQEGFEIIAVPLASFTLVIHPRWRRGGQELIRDIVRSLRVASLPATESSYRVYDLAFDSNLAFDLPRSFAFRSKDSLERLFCDRSPKQPAFKPPVWDSVFELPTGGLVTDAVAVRDSVVSRADPDLVFASAQWFVTSKAPDGSAPWEPPEGASPQLTVAEAWCEVRGERFRLWLASEGGHARAVATWGSVLGSARAE